MYGPSVLAFDGSVGAAAGLNLGGFIGGRAGGEYSGGFAARFSSPQDTARWIFQQLANLQQFIAENTGASFLQLDGAPIAPSTPPVVLTTNTGTGTAGVYVDGVGGWASLDGSQSGSSTTFHQGGQQVTDNGQPVVGQTNERKVEGQGSVSVANWLTINGGFAVAWQSVSGDMNTANNGDYLNVQLSFGFNFNRSVFLTGGSRPNIPRDQVQDSLLDLFEILERQAPNGVSLGLVHTMFDGIVDKLYDTVDEGVQKKVELDINFGIEWNMVHEGGEYRQQYARIGVTVTPRRSLGGSAALGSAEVAVEASKTEVLHEELGDETFSYIFQNYIFARNPGEWSSFASRHQEQIDAMMQNLSNPQHSNYNPELARYMRGQTTYAARLNGLEAFFETQRDSVVIGD